MYFNEELRKFDVIYCDLGKPNIEKGSIQCGVRYCIVVSNDRCCKHSGVIQVVPCTTAKFKSKIPTHMEIDALYGLKEPSLILNEQIISITKASIRRKYGHIDDKAIQDKINEKLRIQLSL